MKGKDSRFLVVALALLVAAGGIGVWAGCDDPNPANCPPRVPCLVNCESASVGVGYTQVLKTPRAAWSKRRSAAWFLITFRMVAGAIRAL